MGRDARAHILTAGLLALLGVACAVTPRVPASWDDSWRWRQGVDSLGVAEFAALPAADRAARRERAADLLRTSPSSSHASTMQTLSAAAGLAPDDPGLWLRLADHCTRIGDHGRALLCLRAGYAALPLADPDRRRDLRLDLILALAMTHRDRGEWASARAWADSATAMEPQERRVLTVRGLTLADHGDVQGAVNAAVRLETAHAFWYEWRWVRGMASFARGDVAEAYHWLREARPRRPYAARFWSDLAMVCERLGLQGEAARFAGYAHDALDLPPGTTGRVEATVPWPGDDEPLRLPLWSAYDGWPAAGSRLGWALAAADSALAAASPARRAHWSDRASGLLSYCIRRGFAPRRCRELRGLVYAGMGADELARHDLRRALQTVSVLDVVDARVPAVQGRLLLKDGRWLEAMPLLREAVAREPRNAVAWGDYGLSLLMIRRTEEGEEALGRAMELDPALAAPWYNRGLARFHAGRWAEAVVDLERAHALAPLNQEIEALLRQAAQRARSRER